MDRPRRSALYLPGSNARAIEKSKELDCDVIIFDIEDAVAPESKSLARNQIRDALILHQKTNLFGNKELILRVNAPNTPWYKDDILAAAAAKPHAVLLPKVESSDQVKQFIEDFGAANGSDDVRVWCMMETPKGILRCEPIASSSDRLDCFVMGTSDLSQELRAHHTTMRLPMLTSLGLCLLAARAFGLGILDGVNLDLTDDDRFVSSCVQGRELGFDGKTLIHPKQIGPCNRVFSPSPSEVERANAIVSAYADARAAGRGVVVLDGRLVEELHVREAQRIIALNGALQSQSTSSAS
jgi:citrate lyase subunit beta/citryl-CoA lyase